MLYSKFYSIFVAICYIVVSLKGANEVSLNKKHTP